MNPLEQLKDIYQPTELGWWPLAYGWWILLVVLLSFVIGLIVISVKAYRKGLIKRLAIKELALIPANAGPSEYNQLLKRAAIGYFPATHAQRLHGEQWRLFLTSTLPKPPTDQQAELVTQLTNQIYQSQPDIDKQALRAFTRTWLTRALPPKKKTLKKWGDSHV